MMIRRLLHVSLAAIVSALVLAPLSAAPSDSPVADAAMHRDAAAVKTLLQQGGDVNAAQGDGMTALHWAALNGDVDLVQMLVYAGANLDATTRLGGYTPLHLAARDGRAAVVEALLKAGASTKTATTSGTTALMLAAGSGSVPAVTALLDHGAEVNARETAKGETALMFAAANGRVDAVKVLLQHGADTKIATRVLDWEKLPKSDPRLPYVEFAKALGLKPGALDAAGKKPAAAGGEAKAAPAAEAEETKPAEAAPKEAEPVTKAAEAAPKGAVGAGIPGSKAAGAPKPNANQAAVFLEFIGAYVKLVGTQGGLTATLFATRQGHADVVRALLDAGADINQADPADHTTPLLSAIINGHFDLAEELLARGADPNAAQVNGVTPLYAVLNCVWASRTLYPQPTAYKQQKTTYLQLMKDLLDRGAKPNVRLKEKVWYSEYNFDLSGVNETGATPFWRAAYADDIDAMKLLLAHGADPTIPTQKPKGPVLGGAGTFGPTPKSDPSGLKPVPVGGPDVTPLLAASGEGYGVGFAANSHRFAPTGMLAAVKYLVEEVHANVNDVDAAGNTVLHNAASRGDNPMILYLVSRGANVKAVNRKGQTVPDLANGPVERINPFPETIALLQKMGATLEHKCISCGG
ncbi:MAG: ankyrin repeat domain-containing protein [Acidobacteriota bacterium]|nr:ankyrin repeat domain-containing protein [Acidobacteriota bacterium]